jgi:hypothetical protein
MSEDPGLTGVWCGCPRPTSGCIVSVDDVYCTVVRYRGGVEVHASGYQTGGLVARADIDAIGV